MSNQNSPDAKAEQLKAATRDANLVLAELKSVLNDIKRTRLEIVGLLEDGVKTRLESEVAKQLAKLSEATDKQMRMAVDKVTQEFQKIEDIFLGHDRASEGNLEDVIRAGMCEIHGVHRSLCRKMVHQ